MSELKCKEPYGAGATWLGAISRCSHAVDNPKVVLVLVAILYLYYNQDTCTIIKIPIL